MKTISFSLKSGNSSELVIDEHGFIDRERNKPSILEAWDKYRQEKEDEAFKNQPPELFKFWNFELNDGVDNYIELVGAESEQDAISLIETSGMKHIRTISSYEKFCNFDALTIDECVAQTYGWF